MTTTKDSRLEDNRQNKLSPFTIAKTINPLFELSLMWHFSKRDLLTVTFPGVVYTASACIYSSCSLYRTIASVFLSTVHFWCMLLFFNVTNQLCDIEEDRIDKPDRPLVKDMVSVQGARIRSLLYAMASLLIASTFKTPIVSYTFIYCLGSIVNNYFTSKLFWALRTYMTAIGAALPILMGWKSVAPVSRAVWIWFLYCKLYWSLLGHFQDLRDMDGDGKAGRNTFPLLYGENATKKLIRVSGLVLAVVFHYVVKVVAKPSLLTTSYEIIMTFISVFMTNRVCHSSSVREYKFWYDKVFVRYYGLMVLSGSVLMLL